MSQPSPPDIFAFLDYREYLRAYYHHAKQHRRFSYRAFSRKAGLRSPNYLKLVIDGERNLTRDMARRFAAACGLQDEAALYFRLGEREKAERLFDLAVRSSPELKGQADPYLKALH